MTFTFDLRARLLLLVFLLVVAGGVVGVMAYQRLHESSESLSTPPVTHPVVAKPVAPHAVPKTAAKPKAVAKPKHSSPPAQPKHPAKAVDSSDKLPLPIRRALAADQVVVVALYDPGAKIDPTALAEARAGAELAGSAFVPVDVRSHGVDSLNAAYGAVHDPSVLVLRSPKDLVVWIDGFADRDTVAQAALNAAS